MNKSITKLFATAVLFCASVSANASDRPDWLLFLDAGVPIKGAEGRYGADFGKSFLELAGQARLARNFFAECGFAWYPGPRSGDTNFYKSDGFEVLLDGVYKIPLGRKIRPFVKIGVSYAWIISNNACTEQYYLDAGRQTDRWFGVNAGGGVEYKLNGKLLLRLGGVFTLAPNDGEGAVASWGKIFAGLGFALR